MPVSRQVSSPLADERGFTLAELLVCMLILSIMAAIALPAWIDQRAKGEDTEAKLTLSAASVALETYALTEYTFDATRADREAIEPRLVDARDLRVDGDADSYELIERSADGTDFSLVRDSAGQVTRDCTNHGYGLCRGSPDARSNYW